MGTSLHMVQLDLDQPHLFRTGREHGWLPRKVDDAGHLVHHQLKALFGDLSPQPFRILRGHDRWLKVIGYTGADAEALRNHAREAALPADLASIRVEEIFTKAVPVSVFERGRTFSFEVRACPVVRLASSVEVTLRNAETRSYRKGAELDAYLHRRDVEKELETREEVYVEWLRARLGDGAAVRESGLHSFRRVRVLRKVRNGTGPRRTRTPERPDALLRGVLEVHRADLFEEALRKGVGRHRAYGFGMLLLRPQG